MHNFFMQSTNRYHCADVQIFVDQHHGYNNSCVFDVEITAAICNLKPSTRRYYFKLIFTLIANWIKEHALIDLKLNFVVVASMVYSAVGVDRAKLAFTKLYNQLFVPILKPFANMKLGKDCTNSSSVGSHISQAQVLFRVKVKNWKNLHGVWFKTTYLLRALTVQRRTTSTSLIMDSPYCYWKYIEKL